MPRKPVEMSAAWRLRFHRDRTDTTLARVRGSAEKLSYVYRHGTRYGPRGRKPVEMSAVWRLRFHRESTGEHVPCR